MTSVRSVDAGALAEEVAAAVAAVPGVARLASKSAGGVEVATYHARGKVVGVRVRESSVAVHVVAGRLPLPDLIAEIHLLATEVVTAYAGPRAVYVTVEDLDVDGLPGPAVPWATHRPPAMPDLRSRPNTGP